MSNALRGLKSRSLEQILALLLLMTPLVVSGSSLVRATNAASGFVGRSGNHFTLNGQRWYVAGTNNHYLGWGSQVEVDNVLNDAKAMRFNVVRAIMHSAIGSLDNSTPTKWNWQSAAESSNMGMNGVYILYWDPATNKMAYNDSTTTGLGCWDYVLWKAGQLGLKLNIALLDFWQWAGGVQQISANYLGGNYDLSSDSRRYTFFFTDPRTKQFYKDWVNHVLNRVNTITGITYKNDPTIFAWDLMNEPEIDQRYGQSWISEMAAYIKTIDTNHLLASGNEGFTDGHSGSSPLLEITTQPNIDFATWHSYPAYHGLSTSQVQNLIDQHCADAARGGKPVLFQEFAFSSRNSDQASVYQSWIDELYNKDCAGWTFWRLTSIQNSGNYAQDNGEGFDIHNDGGATANVLINAAIKSLARNQARPTSAPCVGCTAVPTPTQNATPIPALTPTPTDVSGTTSIDDSMMGSGQNQFNYVGSWNHCTNCNETNPSLFYSASQTWNATVNDYAILAFKGTQIKYYAVTAPHHGIASISIDGGPEINVDLYSNIKTGNVLKWTSPVLAFGNHTLKIRTSGTKNANSTGIVITLDRVEVIGGIGPTATNTSVALPTFQPPANSPGGVTPARTNTPGESGTNLAPSGTGYTWFNISSTYVGNSRSEPQVNDGNLTTDFSLTGSGDDNPASDEAAGIAWDTAQTIRSVKYHNGTCDPYDNAPFTANLRVQFTTDGITWTTDSSWTISPSYPYDSCVASNQVYTFSGPAKSGIRGVRVIGAVHSTNSSLSRHARAREVQVFS